MKLAHCIHTVLAFLALGIGIVQAQDLVIVDSTRLFGDYNNYPTFTGCARLDSTAAIVIAYNYTGREKHAFARKTTDGGTTWRDILVEKYMGDGFSEPLVLRRFSAIACPTPRLCIIVEDSARMHRSTDGGETWALQKLQGVHDYGIGSIQMSDSLYGMISVDSRLFVTTDGGLRWAPLSTAPRPDTVPAIYGYYVLAIPSRQSALVTFASTDSTPAGVPYVIPRYYRTTDAGLTWKEVQEPSPNRYYLRKYFADSLNGWAAGGIRTGSTGGGTYELQHQVILKTTNGGVTWDTSLHRFTGHEYGMTDVSFSDPMNGIGGGGQAAVQTTDGGATWRAMSFEGSLAIVNFPNVTYLNKNTAILPANGRVYRWKAAASGVRTKPVTPPGLHTAFAPNPTDGGDATLHYTLPAPGRVEITLCNPLGQSLYTQIETTAEAGPHLTTLPCGGLPSGMYIARVHTVAGSVLAWLTVVR